MTTIVRHITANLHRFAFAIEFSPGIHVTYRAAIQSGVSHVQVCIKLQTAQDAIHRSLTGNLALSGQCI